MKTCLICNKDGLRTYRRFKRYKTSNTLHKFDDETFMVCSDAIAIRKMRGLIFGDLVLNNENKNKYGFHIECYRELVAIKRVHVDAWQTAAYKRMSSVYVHSDIKTVIEDKSTTTLFAKDSLPKKSKIMGQAQKTCRDICTKVTTNRAKPVQSKPPAELLLQLTLKKTNNPEISSTETVSETQSVQATASLKATNPPVSERQDRNDLVTNKGSELPIARDPSLSPSIQNCPSVSFCDIVHKRHKDVKQNPPLQTAKALPTKLNVDLINVSTVSLQKPNTGERSRMENVTQKFAEISLNKKQFSNDIRQEPEPKTTDSHYGVNAQKYKRLCSTIEKRLKNLQSAQAALTRKPKPEYVHTNSFRSKIPPKKPPGLPLGICNIQPMSFHEIYLVRNAISDEIKKEKAGDEPRFIRIVNRPGYLLLICGDHYSQQWLIRTATRLKPWQGAQLYTVFESELPKCVVVTVFVPSVVTYSPMELLKQLKEHNSGLMTEYWRVLSVSDVSEGRMFHLSLNETSVENLQKLNCKASVCLTTIHFKIKGGTYNVQTKSS